MKIGSFTFDAEVLPSFAFKVTFDASINAFTVQIQ